MRIVLQKVSHAGVTVTDEAIGELDTTITEQTIAAGVSDADGTRQIDCLAHKISNLRVFEDEQGKMNLSIHDVGGSILSISQFTLFADTRKGNRPSFVRAGKPEHAERVWLEFNEALRAQGLQVKEGRFGAHMNVSLVNDGPVTILFDTEELGI